MQTKIYDSNTALGYAAAEDLANILCEAVNQHGETSVILATGNSQLSLMEALRERQDIPWAQVRIFHMDEYLGMSDKHPASFRRYFNEKLFDIIEPKAFYGIEGGATDVEAELKRYTALLEEYPPVVCVLGIGENGHLAFNDPPADFETVDVIHIVELAEMARQQQVGEGHFAGLDEVPKQAITLTVPVLLKPDHVLAIVPEARKAPAVRESLEGPVTPDCPASILRMLDHVKLYLDRDSASLLSLE